MTRNVLRRLCRILFLSGMGFIAAAASAQTSRYEELAKLPFEQGFPNKQTSLALTDELVFQRAVQAYLWALPTNRHHFFEPNEIKRYSTGTKNTALKYDSDGSLTLYVQADPPAAEMRGNWLPTPKAAEFLLYLRGYWPQVAINDGSWMPPPVVKAK